MRDILVAAQVVVWMAFGLWVVSWAIQSEAAFALQESAPQQAACAARTAAVTIMGYSLVRAITGALRAFADGLVAPVQELLANMRRQDLDETEDYPELP